MHRYFSIAILTMASMVAIGTNASAQNDAIVTHTAVIKTTLGDVDVNLYGEDAPKAVENFIGLAKQGFYRGLRFHRVIPKFVIQTGDPSTVDTNRRSEWGLGGKSIWGKPFEDELNPNSPSFRQGYVEGTLAMANRGPNTNTSQFFIVLSNNIKLEKRYTIFGRVVTGDTTNKSMDVIHAIERADLADPKLGLPVRPVMVLDVVVTPVAQSTEPKKGK
ncbi:MAG: peptidylprolyl isomerase [Bacteroidota bacterium]